MSLHTCVALFCQVSNLLDGDSVLSVETRLVRPLLITEFSSFRLWSYRLIFRWTSVTFNQWLNHTKNHCVAPTTSSQWRQQQAALTWPAVIRPDGGLLWGGLALFAVGWLSFAVWPSMVSRKFESFSSSSCWGCLVKTAAASWLFLKKLRRKIFHDVISPLGEGDSITKPLWRKEEKSLGSGEWGGGSTPLWFVVSFKPMLCTCSFRKFQCFTCAGFCRTFKQEAEASEYRQLNTSPQERFSGKTKETKSFSIL